MPTLDVNWIAVVVAAVAPMIIGTLWYGPLFGKLWMRSLGKTSEELGSPSTGIAVSIVASLITATIVSVVINAVGAGTIMEGIVWGVLLSVGLIATSTATNSVYENKSWTVTFLFIAYQVVTLAVMGAIVAAWG